MHRIHDDGTFDIVRGDSAEFEITPYCFEGVEDPIEEDLPEYYELYDGEFIHTLDKTIDPDKDYYILTEYELGLDELLTFTVKKNTKTKDVIFQKYGSRVEIAPEDTENCKYGTYQYDVELSNTTRTKVDTIVEPTPFNIKPEVTF